MLWAMCCLNTRTPCKLGPQPLMTLDLGFATRLDAWKTNPSNSSPWKSLTFPKRTFHDACSLLTNKNVKTSFHSLHIKRRRKRREFYVAKQRFFLRLTAEGSHVRNARQELLDQHILVDVTTVGIRWNHVGLDVKPLQKQQLTTP